ncbi:DNRLRE domain-containing protein [Streptomyces antarcticus]|uniref:DNRLRE domain-containing protein n=1 Tax=Streptomyces antarcticus TaxID=2996458 RepID=UPI00226E5495|nr:MULTISPECIES: LamG-like jellyroll fold domain-containing protein [unclassified Streptomyces]MCY0944843.1 DNRLRE domain-containing protein [Streptomyces sp. H34-AA3]MCZ4083395.1 DNRLRE domain-containing protein [Streptomyces sp. H34-S5]
MRRSRGLAAALGLSLAATGATIGLGLVPQAAAITPPVAFTADALATWQPNGVVWALAEAGGKVFVGGTFSVVRPPTGGAGSEQSAVNFVALDAATGAPTACALSFTVGGGTATVRALTLSPDRQTLYAGGYFGAVNGTPVSSLAAIDVATCTVKTGFRPAFAATVRALAVTGDTVYAGGDFLTVAGQQRERFAAVDADNGALRPFTADADEPGRAVEVTPDGSKVILGGDFFTVNGTNTHALAVVDATTGALATSYPGFIENNSVVKDVATDATGFYTANEGTGGGVFDGRIALNLADLGQRWRDTCLGATQAVLPYQDVLYSASHAHDCSSVGEFPDGQRHHLLAQPTTGTGKLGWAPDTNDGIGEGIGPRVMAVGSKSGVQYLWVGGEFTTVNGAAQQSLTRFASTGDTGAPTVPVAGAVSFAPGEAQVRWRTSLDLDDSALTYKIYRNGAATPIATVNADSLFFRRPQASWTDTTVSAGQSYTYRVTATDAAGNASALSGTASVTVPTSVDGYPNQVRADGAQQFWRYDESVPPFAADSSVSGNQAGVHLNGPALRQTPGAVTGASTAIGFDGTNTQVYGDKRQNVGSTYTVETWFRTNTTRGGKLVGFGNNQDRTSSQYDKHVYMTNDGRLVFGVYTGATRTVTTSAAYNDNTWHHVVATQGPVGMTLYVDGVQKGTLNVTTHENFSGYWHAGGDNLGGWPDRPTSDFWAGRLDETAVYPTVLSAAQVQNHFTLASAPADSVVEVTASEDTYANAGAPGTNYGTSGSLAVRGSSFYASYLRFELPAAPAGTVLKSAVLGVKTSTMSGAGTADTVSVVPVTGAWTEAGTTYTNRPALGGTALGTFAGVPDGSAVHSTGLNTPAVAAALGTGYGLALTSSGTDALWLWSSEAQANEGTPRLTLTFGAP